MPLFTPGGFIHLTEGMNHERITQKVAGLPRGVVVCITALVIYVPLLFIVVQSFLSAPFFPAPNRGVWKPSPLFLPTRIFIWH